MRRGRWEERRHRESLQYHFSVETLQCHGQPAEQAKTCASQPLWRGYPAALSIGGRPLIHHHMYRARGPAHRLPYERDELDTSLRARSQGLGQLALAGAGEDVTGGRSCMRKRRLLQRVGYHHIVRNCVGIAAPSRDGEVAWAGVTVWEEVEVLRDRVMPRSLQHCKEYQPEYYGGGAPCRYHACIQTIA